MTDEQMEIENGLKKYFAVKAILMYNDKILLMKLYPKYTFLGGLWEVPGGRKKIGESDDEALHREVKEETGLDVEIVRMIHEWKIFIKESNSWLAGKTFLCRSKTDKVVLTDPEKQHEDYKWVSVDEAKKFRIPEWLRESLEKI